MERAAAGDAHTDTWRRSHDSAVPAAAAVVPRGVMPPQSGSEERRSVNTQMLIANIAEELTAEDPEPVPPARPETATQAMPLSTSPAFPTRTVAMSTMPDASTAPHPSLQRERPLWLWAAALVAGVVLVGSLVAIVRQQDGEEALAQGEDRSAHHELAQHETLADAEGREAKAATIRSGAAGAVVAAKPPTPDAGLDGQDPPPPVVPEIAVPVPVPLPVLQDDATDEDSELETSSSPSSKATSSSRSRTRARRTKSSEPVAAPAPAPASPAAAPSEPSAAELLAQSRDALRQGDASAAYRLASRSNGKKSSQSALQIMAKAACRMKSRDKAKSAFDRLAMADRAGIRSECRNHGVRLGL